MSLIQTSNIPDPVRQDTSVWRSTEQTSCEEKTNTFPAGADPGVWPGPRGIRAQGRNSEEFWTCEEDPNSFAQNRSDQFFRFRFTVRTSYLYCTGDSDRNPICLMRFDHRFPQALLFEAFLFESVKSFLGSGRTTQVESNAAKQITSCTGGFGNTCCFLIIRAIGRDRVSIKHSLLSCQLRYNFIICTQIQFAQRNQVN